MARADKVTRTFKTAKVTAMVVDTTNGTVKDYTAVFPKPFKDDEKALKALNNMLDDGLRAVAIKGTEIIETLYEMTAETFLLHANAVEKR